MIIRDYTERDELEWLRCRVVSFLDSSYYNDVLIRHESYDNEFVSLVAEENDIIIGLIEAEIECSPNDLCVADDNNKPGAVIWHLAVLPEYRRLGVATKLWNELQKQLLHKHIHHCEAWTQEDKTANCWYVSQGFRNIEAKNWLRCYVRPSKANWFLNERNVGEIYGVEEMIFEVSTSRREEISDNCYRIDEVRLYVKQI